jgi:hypothetical protein
VISRSAGVFSASSPSAAAAAAAASSAAATAGAVAATSCAARCAAAARRYPNDGTRDPILLRVVGVAQIRVVIHITALWLGAVLAAAAAPLVLFPSQATASMMLSRNAGGLDFFPDFAVLVR